MNTDHLAAAANQMRGDSSLAEKLAVWFFGIMWTLAGRGR